MIEFKANNLQIFDVNNSDVIYEFRDIDNAIIETEIETSSMAQETLKFNHEITFSTEMTDYSPLLFGHTITDLNDKPLSIEYSIPIMIQARWHKKPRINKKWLKRYGMKKDEILVRCDVDSISLDDSYDPYDLVKSNGFNIEVNNMQYKFRPDQLRKNLKMEMCY